MCKKPNAFCFHWHMEKTPPVSQGENLLSRYAAMLWRQTASQILWHNRTEETARCWEKHTVAPLRRSLLSQSALILGNCNIPGWMGDHTKLFPCKPYPWKSWREFTGPQSVCGSWWCQNNEALSLILPAGLDVQTSAKPSTVCRHPLAENRLLTSSCREGSGRWIRGSSSDCDIEGALGGSFT